MATGKFHSSSKQVKFKTPGDHEISKCNHRLNGKYIHYKPKTSIEGKELVHVDEIGGQRKLIVPSRKPIDLPGIWPKSEMDRLMKQSHVVTLADKIAMMEEDERKKIQLQNESEARKAKLKKMQKVQTSKQGSKLSEVEDEARRKNLYLLQRAIELRQEQEEDVKNLNSVILATKCMAIRDAQIGEKELIKRQMGEEEKRLDMMMEQRRQQSLEEAKLKQKQEEEKNARYVTEVQHQIKENDIQRLIEAERKEEEAKLINKAMIAMQREEAEKLEQKKQIQTKMWQSLRQANDELEHFKKIKQEEDRIADLRIQEFMRKKAEREAEREAEENASKEAKLREISRLRGLQQKMQDAQEIMNEMNAARIQEEVERKWREKELDEAKKRKDQAEQMRVGRERQLHDLRRAQALEIARDEQLFHEVNKRQKELYDKEMAEIARRKEEAARHRKELLKQIEEKERERINYHKEKFEEGNAMRIEQELHNITVKTLLHSKVGKLKESNLPEKYVNDIIRQANIPHTHLEM